jgi:hypothetical protein
MLVVLLTAGAAQSLAGVNTVFSDDIVDGTIQYADLKDGALGGKKILDKSVIRSKIADGAIDGSKIADGSVTRQDLGLEVIAGVTKVSQLHQVGANQTGNFTVVCPTDAPIVLGGGYEWGNSVGFNASTSEPWYVDGQPNGWFVGGTNGLAQGKNLYVVAICASDGSND